MARDFDGATNYISTPFSSVTSITMSCWIKYDAASSCPFSICVSGSAANRVMILINPAGTLVAQEINTAGTAASATSVAALTTGVWGHACAVFESSTSRHIYVNGGNKVTNTTSVSHGTIDLAIVGMRRNNGSNGLFYNGLIGAPGIWNVVLSDDEIAALGAGYNPNLIRPQSLVSHNLFDPRNLDIKGNTWTNNGSTDSFDNPPLRG